MKWKDLVPTGELGIGTWAWGDRSVWGYGKEYGEQDLEAAFRASIDSGITFFDTAEIYGKGKSEQFIGKFRHALEREVIVATKFFPYPWRLNRNDLIAALKQSLHRLGMPCVDLYQIHWPLHVRSLHVWMDAMAEAVEKGLTKAVGVSNYSVGQMLRARDALAKRGIPLISNQVEFSLLKRKPENSGLLKACAEHGIMLLAYSPIAMGILSGKYSTAHAPVGVRRYRYRSMLPQVEKLVRIMTTLGEEHGGKTPSQVALNWVICKGAFPIPGAKTAKQAVENAGAQGWRLEADEIFELDEATRMLFET
ncbi:MAG: aldo/keto reductase [bacterium]